MNTDEPNIILKSDQYNVVLTTKPLIYFVDIIANNMSIVEFIKEIVKELGSKIFKKRQ